MRSALAIVIGIATGFGAAAAIFGLGSTTAPESRSESAADATARSWPPDANELPVVAQSATEGNAARTSVSRSSDAQADTRDARFSPELETYARDGIDTAWNRLRSRPMPSETMEAGWNEFRGEVLALPERIGTRLATDANAADALAAALAASDAFELLKQLDAGEVGPFEDLVGDASAFAKLFECKSGGGAVVDGAALAREPSPEVVDGAELRHPAGVYRVDLSRLNRRTKFPRCLAVRGAGMDRTLLVWETVRTRDRVERIEISDLTLFSTNVFDLRHDFATIVLERVRIVGFDCGAGSSAAFDTHGNALLARDSRIEGGFGRSPGGGSLFDVRTPALLARFENCVLSRVAIEARGLRERSTVVFDHCDFIDTTESRETFVSPHRGLVFVGCRATSRNDEDDDDPMQLDLNDLFPGWRQAR